jgi:hypothetical protein
VLGLGEMCLHFVVIASSLESSSYDVGMTEYMVSLLKGVSVFVFSKRTSKAISERKVIIESKLDEAESHASIVVYNERGFKEVIHLTKSILEMSDIDWQFNDMSLPTKSCSHCFKPLESDAVLRCGQCRVFHGIRGQISKHNNHSSRKGRWSFFIGIQSIVNESSRCVFVRCTTMCIQR